MGEVLSVYELCIAFLLAESVVSLGVVTDLSQGPLFSRTARGGGRELFPRNGGPE